MWTKKNLWERSGARIRTPKNVRSASYPVRERNFKQGLLKGNVGDALGFDEKHSDSESERLGLKIAGIIVFDINKDGRDGMKRRCVDVEDIAVI